MRHMQLEHKSTAISKRVILCFPCKVNKAMLDEHRFPKLFWQTLVLGLWWFKCSFSSISIVVSVKSLNHSLGYFSRPQNDDMFIFFTENRIWHFTQTVFIVFREKYEKNISIYRLLKILPRVLSEIYAYGGRLGYQFPDVYINLKDFLLSQGYITWNLNYLCGFGNRLRRIDTLSGELILSKLFASLLKRVLILKRKSLHLGAYYFLIE